MKKLFPAAYNVRTELQLDVTIQFSLNYMQEL